MIVEKNKKFENGFFDSPLPKNFDLINEINKLKREKNAIILAHYYQQAEVQDIADYIGDSLGLSERAAKVDAEIIVFAGVHFMAETAKILSPEKKVLIPDLNAGCSLADSCPPEEFKKFIDKHPSHTVITYVNTTAEIKSLSDVCCTSSNAVQIVESFSKDEKLLFAPDRNLGNYIKRLTGRENMVVWDGACHVHEEFSLERILEIKKENPEAKLISHPECQKPILLVSDYIGSTSELLKYVKTDSHQKYIVATEWGILHQMQKTCSDKIFIAAPPKDSSCGCNECSFMKLITLKKIYLALQNEQPEVHVDKKIIERARKPIERMLELSIKLGII